ncbi:hypothetical protein [Mesorhizobium neociceri]|uniref:Uncharacterized protein n=1 Tax=Mesorhizobium neociceri TaxID=1307853 RepID=A0A838BFR1_9HYPH|nr:hypothetical protein [Mesorhizobium neociceri]MBA1144721.1 hypothetical protein [Mesorhizobium neociceri]
MELYELLEIRTNVPGMRFVVIMDPADQWLVYDEVVGVPTERDGEVLVALSREAAERLASEANFSCAVGMLVRQMEPAGSYDFER